MLLQILGQPINKSEKGNRTNILRKKRKWNNKICSIKTMKGRKNGGQKLEQKTRVTYRKQQ